MPKVAAAALTPVLMLCNLCMTWLTICAAAVTSKLTRSQAAAIAGSHMLRSMHVFATTSSTSAGGWSSTAPLSEHRCVYSFRRLSPAATQTLFE